ncbi:hypothetical protein SNE40_005444 [Patella caerulea]|uniref:Uncharacterized protein n=1 Tax=Patella caerulea TaxID=87958 RepID=A0AAN8PWE5_PATCE
MAKTKNKSSKSTTGAKKPKPTIKKTKEKVVKKTEIKKKTKAAIDEMKNGETSKASPKHYPKLIDEDTNFESPDKLVFTAKPCSRNNKGELIFEDFKEFRPNLTPKEVLQAGSFGGTYFRPIKSSVTGKKYSSEVWKELPSDWLKSLNIGSQVACSKYDESVNKYGVKCGGSLEMWESSGWIHKQDPYGWFQWYCRFYQGRRTPDDERQIGRWLRCAGKTGRWKNNLISKCVNSGCGYDNVGVSPVVRQTLLHWGYTLTKEDFDAEAKRLKKKK